MALLAMPALAHAESIAGPFEASYVSAYDGDTVRLNVRVWLGITVHTAIRIRGVDAPEIRGACQTERVIAVAARDFMSACLAAASALRISNVTQDKYGDRVVADIDVDGQSAAALLIQAGLARVYEGGAREGWCGR